jgi:hypothetical protein
MDGLARRRIAPPSSLMSANTPAKPHHNRHRAFAINLNTDDTEGETRC